MFLLTASPVPCDEANQRYLLPAFSKSTHLDWMAVEPEYTLLDSFLVVTDNCSEFIHQADSLDSQAVSRQESVRTLLQEDSYLPI